MGPQERIEELSRPRLPDGAATEESLVEIKAEIARTNSLASSPTGLTDAQLRATPVDVALNAASLSALETTELGATTLAALETISVGNFPATQAISAASLPLPTGASKAAGAANLVTGQVTASTSANTFVAARATRRAVLIKNLSTSITVYFGPATVTVSNGMELKPGESTVVNWVGLIQVIAASGSPVVAYSDEYD